MNYFLLQEDERLNNKIELNNYPLSASKDLEPIFVKEKIKQPFAMPDYITKRFVMDIRHLVTQKIIDVLQLFYIPTETKVVIVMDPEFKQPFVYYELKLPNQDCIVFKENTYKDINAIELDSQRMDPKMAVFQAYVDKNKYTFIRFDVAECIVKRKSLGIRFVPIPFAPIPFAKIGVTEQ